MTAGRTFRDVSDTAGVRWYRHGGNRLSGPIMILLPGLFPAVLIVYGLGHPVRWTLLVPGAVLIAAIAALACLPLRAGIGVTPDRILIRTAFGTTAVPWEEVTGFEGGKDSPESGREDAVFVLTSGGERLHTAGYAPTGTSPAALWRLLRTLEDERLARTPGAASTLPPPPRPPKPGEIGEPNVFAVLGLIALIVAGTVIMSIGAAEIGPGIRAARGGGTAGYYIPQHESTGKGARWHGEFRLPDGTVIIQDAGIQDVSPGALRAGVPVAARDTGDANGVFPRDDPGAWHSPAAFLAAAAWLYVVALVAIIGQWIRWLRRDRSDGEGNVAPSPRAAGHPDLRTQDPRPQADRPVPDAESGDLRRRVRTRIASSQGCRFGDL